MFKPASILRLLKAITLAAGITLASGAPLAHAARDINIGLQATVTFENLDAVEFLFDRLRAINCVNFELHVWALL